MLSLPKTTPNTLKHSKSDKEHSVIFTAVYGEVSNTLQKKTRKDLKSWKVGKMNMRIIL